MATGSRATKASAVIAAADASVLRFHTRQMTRGGFGRPFFLVRRTNRAERVLLSPFVT